ncbi:type I-E CRISPR-associated protein Cas7/Cse4/CasC, partial [bacterium]|nr:type I-E CRISPR-associated protein Cas7/Cse4/CasC [bacterium]
MIYLFGNVKANASNGRGNSFKPTKGTTTMLIEIHIIQNHSPANLNRDDLGAPKTCYFGGVLRSRISSQCIKRSIRMSDEFKELLGGVRTRQLVSEIAKRVTGKADVKKRAEKILQLCGFKAKKAKKKDTEADDSKDSDKSKMLVYTSRDAIDEMAKLLENDDGKTDEQLARDFGQLISERVAMPDMALCGRMLEPDKSAKKVWE